MNSEERTFPHLNPLLISSWFIEKNKKKHKVIVHQYKEQTVNQLANGLAGQ